MPLLTHSIVDLCGVQLVLTTQRFQGTQAQAALYVAGASLRLLSSAAAVLFSCPLSSCCVQRANRKLQVSLPQGSPNTSISTGPIPYAGFTATTFNCGTQCCSGGTPCNDPTACSAQDQAGSNPESECVSVAVGNRGKPSRQCQSEQPLAPMQLSC